MSDFPVDDFRRLVEALQIAFTRKELEQLLFLRLNGRRLDVLVAEGPLSSMAFDLAGLALREGWIRQLVRAAREARPRDSLLSDLAERHQLTPELLTDEPALSGSSLESIVRAVSPLLDVAVWREQLARAERRVCRIEVAFGTGTSFGTGFLVGPDAVLTNYHVVENAIHPGSGARVSARFDYLVAPGGAALNPGIVFQVATEWLVDSSPYDPSDLSPSPEANDSVSPERLDYALIRLAGSPGTSGSGITADAPRGWFEIAAADDTLATGSPLYILQHPRAEPLKLAIDTEAVLGFNSNRTRLHYRTNTLNGSSGSPCFDRDWNLVALHHCGDPAWLPTYNQGVPISAIRRLWDQRGLWARAGIPRPT